MPRKLRLEFSGACYHVINRGNYRRDLFARPDAAESFYHCLEEACESFGWLVHAFSIMRNHFHLALETPEPNLSLGMQWLQGTWAQRFNRFRGVTGRGGSCPPRFCMKAADWPTRRPGGGVIAIT